MTSPSRTCWGCGVEHTNTELPSLSASGRDWRDLCDQCLPEYDEGKEYGWQAIQAGRSDFERRGMTSIRASGYMAGRFLAAAHASRERRAGRHPWLQADIIRQGAFAGQ